MPSCYWPPTRESPTLMGSDRATAPTRYQAGTVDDTVRIVVNHESVVTDTEGNAWLPYLLQGGDGAILRLGMIRREALKECRSSSDEASGTTSHAVPNARQTIQKQCDIGGRSLGW